MSFIRMSSIKFTPNIQCLSLIKSFENGETPSKLAYINATQNNRIARLTYEFESQGDLTNGEYGYSVLCKFIEPTELDEFEMIEQEAVNFLPKDIEFKSVLREEGRVYIKLPIKDGKFVPLMDPHFLPDQLDKSPIHEGSILDIEFRPSVWINFEQRTAGIYFKISQVTINGGKKKTFKRR